MYEMKPGVVTEMTASTQVSVRLGIESERAREREDALEGAAKHRTPVTIEMTRNWARMA